jgi:hypothetical protein
MRSSPVKSLALAVLAVGLVGIVTDQVLASTSTVKGKGKVFQYINFTDTLTANQFNSNIVQVPAGQVFVITDVLVTNQSGDLGTFAIRCLDGASNPLIMAPTLVADDTSFQYAFTTGVQCTEETQAQLSIAATTSLNWSVTVSGYMRKGAP